MKRKVYFYGHLKKKYGHMIEMCVSSVPDVVRLMQANHRDFFSQIRGKKYQIVAGDLEEVPAKKGIIDQDILGIQFPDNRPLHFIPVTEGAGSGKGWLGVVLGIALVAVAWWNPMGWAVATQVAVGGFGVSLALTGISSLLSPVPKAPENKDDKKTSFLFAGQPMSAEQGLPVPIVYGDMTIGGIIVSGGIMTEDFSGE